MYPGLLAWTHVRWVEKAHTKIVTRGLITFRCLSRYPALREPMKTEPCKYCDGTGRQIDQKQLGKELRKARESAGMSLRDMATALKLSAPYLSDLERGNRGWSTELIARFKSKLAPTKRR